MTKDQFSRIPFSLIRLIILRTVLLYDLALELLGAPPFPDALEAVAVAAVGEDAETAFTGVGFLKHHLHAHATHHVFTTLDGKRDFHVLLVSLNAGLPLTNNEMLL